MGRAMDSIARLRAVRDEEERKQEEARAASAAALSAPGSRIAASIARVQARRNGVELPDPAARSRSVPSAMGKRRTAADMQEERWTNPEALAKSGSRSAQALLERRSAAEEARQAEQRAAAEPLPVSRAIERSNADILYRAALARVEQDRHTAGDIYSNDFAAREAERQRREANEQALSAAARNLDRLGMRPSAAERVGATVAGAAKQSASGFLNAADLYQEAGRQASQRQAEGTSAIAEGLGGGLAGAAFANIVGYTPGPGAYGIATGGTPQYDTRGNQERFWANRPLRDRAEALARSAAEDLERAKSYTGKLGQFAVDVGASGVQMLGDAALNAVAPGSGLAALGVRAAGSAAMQARQAGATEAEQALYGGLIGGVEVFTEKLFDGLAGAYGRGNLDSVVNKALDRLQARWKLSEGGRALMRILASGAEEGAEELIAGVIDPALESIYNGKAVYENYSADTLADMLYETAAGAALGVLGGAGGSVRSAIRYNQIAGDPAALSELGIDAAGKNRSQLRQEVRRALEGQEAPAAPEPQPETAPEIQDAQPQPERQPEIQQPQPVRGQGQAAPDTDVRRRFVAETAREMAQSGSISGGAAEVLSDAYRNGQDASVFVSAMLRYYNAGKNGIAYDAVQPAPELISGQPSWIYTLGAMEARRAAEQPAAVRTADGAAAAAAVDAATAETPDFSALAVEQPAETQMASHAAARSTAPETAGARSGLVIDDYVQDHLDAEMTARIDRVAASLGVNVRFVDMVRPRTVDGVTQGTANAELQGSEIQIEKGNQNPVLYLLGHEWTHRIQQLAPAEYGTFRDAVAEEVRDEAAQLQTLYEQAGEPLTGAEALDEAAANFAGRMLQDGKILDSFLEKQNRNRPLLRRMWDAVRGLAAKLTGAERRMARTAEGKLRAALSAAADAARRLDTGTPEAIAEADETSAESAAASRTSPSLKGSERAATAAELYREGERLRGEIERWRRTAGIESTPVPRDEDIKKTARNLVRKFQSKTRPETLEAEIRGLWQALSTGEADSVYTEARRRAENIVRPVLERAEAVTNSELVNDYAELRNTLRRSPVTISQKDAHDVSADWGQWRAANRRYVNISINGQGTPVDVAYSELSQSHPALFPEDITAPGDMAVRMVEVAQTLEPVLNNPYSADMAEAVDYAASYLLDTMMDKNAVRATRVTQQTRRVNQAITDYRQKVTERLEADRQERDRRVREVTEHYRQKEANQRARKQESEDRAALMNVMRRLSKIKTTSANRAVIQEILGDLDTVYQRLKGKKLEDLQALFEEYKKDMDENPDWMADPLTEARLESLSKRHIGDLDISEVRQLTAALQHIENQIRTNRRLIDSEDRRSTYLLGNRVIDDVRAAGGSAAFGPKAAVDSVLTGVLSPERMIRRMTGWVDGDPLQEAAAALSEGQRKTLDYQRRAERLFERWYNDRKFYAGFSGKDAPTVRIGALSADGGSPVQVEITPAMRASLYLHSLNRQNLRHIVRGGVTVPDIKLYRKGNLAEAYTRGQTVKLTRSMIQEAVSGMTEAEKALAEAARRYFNSTSRDAINETSEKLLGYSLAGVENYFPITTDRAFSHSESDAILYDGRLEGMGFLKARVNASNPIMLQDLNDVLSRSIRNHAKYYGLAIPVRNFNKILGVNRMNFNADGSRTSYTSSVQKTIGQVWGSNGRQYLDKLMTDIQNGRSASDEQLDRLLGALRSNYAGATLMINGGVAIKQAASYPTAGAVVGWGPLAKAIPYLLPGKNADTTLIERYTPLLWYRSLGYSSAELADMANRDSTLQRVLNTRVLNWIQAVDVKTTKALWMAAEYYVRDQKGSPQRGTDEYYRAVADVYNRIIEETQPNYTTMQRPQLLRSNSQMVQSMMMFMNQPLQNFGITYDAFGDLLSKRAAAKNTGAEEARTAYRAAQQSALRAASSQIVQLAVFSAMQFAWDAFRGRLDDYKDEDGNVTPLSVLRGLGVNMLGSAVATIPLGREVFEAAKAITGGGRYYGMDTIGPSAISDFLSLCVKAGQRITKRLSADGEEKEIDWNAERHFWEDTFLSLGQLAGFPGKNIKNLVDALYRHTAKNIPWQIDGKFRRAPYIGEHYALLLTTEKQSGAGAYMDNLYQAMTRGPETEYRALYDIMTGDSSAGGFTEDKIASAMESRMKATQGVDSTADLERRWLAPEKQEHYDTVYSAVQNTELWKSANQQAQNGSETAQSAMDAATTALYHLAKETKTGATHQEKIDNGAESGLTEAHYILFLAARKLADKPSKSGKTGSYTKDEINAALNMISDLSPKERTYLKSLQ